VRRRQVVEPVAVDAEGVPDCLLAGSCLEVWTPGWKGDRDKRWYAARRLYKDAVDLYKQRHGIGCWEHRRLPGSLKKGFMPWSFRYLAENDPDRLAGRLEFCGLPPDWQPTPAPPEWLETPAPWPPYRGVEGGR
jgi:hypothetical protein